MRIRLIIEDEDYCNALKNTLSSLEKDVYVELGCKGVINKLDDSTIIITDISPELVDKKLYQRTIFLSNNSGDKFDSNAKVFKIFKYSNICNILGGVEELNFILSGETENSFSTNSHVYAVCTNRSDRNAELCRALARQILFRHGGEIIILPMRYINDYSNDIDSGSRDFSRMMYYLKIGKKFPITAFTYCDSYGISYLKLPEGINPLSNLKYEELRLIIKTLSLEKFGTVIVDIADCFSKANIKLLKCADNILFFDDGKKNINIKEIAGEDNYERCKKIELHNQDKTVELQIDDYIKKIYWS